MKYATNDQYFQFSKRELRAIIVLIGLILLVKVTPYFWVLFNKNDIPVNKNELAAIKKLRFERISEEKSVTSSIKADRRTVKPFYFDPNLIGLSEWQKLGLSGKQAQSILNYKAKGGRFFRAEDLQKMYVIHPGLYRQLKPFVKINPTSNQSSTNYASSPKLTHKLSKQLLQVEINTADSALLDQIKGIGPAFATRIIKYRNRLGGFINKNQLLEVYGIDSLKFKEMESQIIVDETLIKKINLNTVVFDELKKFPYLTFKEMNAIIQYRKQHGNYTGMDDLKKVLILSPQKLKQIAPYLQF